MLLWVPGSIAQACVASPELPGWAQESFLKAGLMPSKVTVCFWPVPIVQGWTFMTACDSGATRPRGLTPTQIASPCIEMSSCCVKSAVGFMLKVLLEL